MPRVGFEPTITVFEGPKAFHAVARAATVIGAFILDLHKMYLRIMPLTSYQQL
jgi:hypothetical protein